MKKTGSDEAKADYQYWHEQDKKTRNRINKLLKDIEVNGNKGIGKPESLKGEWAGYWSRRIDKKNRLIYKIDGELLKIAQCRTHYKDK